MHSIAKDPVQSVTQITDHLAEVRDRVRTSLARAGRAADAAAILAVSKQQPVAAIEAAFHAGQVHFGESYVQEALPKIAALKELPICWHFIGRIQSNKTRAIAQHFHWVHTVADIRTARRLSEQRPHYAPRLNVLIQVNQGHEPQKGGVEPADVARLARDIMPLARIHLRGLMSIPPPSISPGDSAARFRELRVMQEALCAEGLQLDELSMGMSADFEEASMTCSRS
jgi:pyridoxal phosphate enzyme (YggS family)